MIVRLDRRQHQVWIAGRRRHHGFTGAVLVAVGLALPNPWGPVLFGVGAALLYDDWADRSVWFGGS